MMQQNLTNSDVYRVQEFSAEIRWPNIFEFMNEERVLQS